MYDSVLPTCRQWCSDRLLRGGSLGGCMIPYFLPVDSDVVIDLLRGGSQGKCMIPYFLIETNTYMRTMMYWITERIIYSVIYHWMIIQRVEVCSFISWWKPISACRQPCSDKSLSAESQVSYFLLKANYQHRFLLLCWHPNLDNTFSKHHTSTICISDIWLW